MSDERRYICSECKQTFTEFLYEKEDDDRCPLCKMPFSQMPYEPPHETATMRTVGGRDDLQTTIDTLAAELQQACRREVTLAAQVVRLESILARWRESEDEPDDELCASHDAYMRDYPVTPRLSLQQREGAAPGLEGERQG